MNLKHHSIIKLSQVSKKIGKSQVLSDINLTISKGEVFWFLWPNGAGKTTTMKAILGLVKPDAGTVCVFWDEWLSIQSKMQIGFMPENTYLYKYLTWEEFLRFNGKFYGMENSILEEKISGLLERVWLAKSRKKKLNSYSKGMLQRIGLAQSILHDPELIFLDEPMSGLDPIGRKMVKDLIIELWKSGKTIFFNTHILSDVEAICDSFAIISGGRIVANMKVSELKEPLEDYFMKNIGEGVESK
jgi:ABC-2 type transport system ATP-binding protein